MNPLNLLNDIHESPRAWSARLGNLAAKVSPEKALDPGTGSTRLAAVLQHLRQQLEARRESLRDIRDAEFVAP
jgi:hypothetical protein